jgi:L-amino acid N-acyltransferase YncA
MIMGLIDEYKGKRIGSVLLSRVCEAMIANGYEKVAGTWVLEDNLGSRRIVESLGGKVDLHWEMYSKIPAISE